MKKEEPTGSKDEDKEVKQQPRESLFGEKELGHWAHRLQPWRVSTHGETQSSGSQGACSV